MKDMMSGKNPSLDVGDMDKVERRRKHLHKRNFVCITYEYIRKCG
jgi:hypothetical protein